MAMTHLKIRNIAEFRRSRAWNCRKTEHDFAYTLRPSQLCQSRFKSCGMLRRVLWKLYASTLYVAKSM